MLGQNQGVGAGGWGLGGWGLGVGFFYEISSEINCTHIYLSDMLGGGHPYVRHDVTHTHFRQKLDLDPWAMDPSPPIFS